MPRRPIFLLWWRMHNLPNFGFSESVSIGRLRLSSALLSLSWLLLMDGCASQYGYDNLASANWDNRHAKFLGELIGGSIGKDYPPDRCATYCQAVPVSDTTVRYKFEDRPRKGCTYWYDVNRTTNVIVAADFEGSKEACSLTLN